MTLDHGPPERISPGHVDRILGRDLVNLLPEEKRYWILVPVTGLVAGLFAVLLQKLLGLIQQLCWGTSEDVHAAAEEMAKGSPWKLVLILALCGGLFAALRFFLGVRSALQGTPAIIEALAFKRGRLPPRRTLIDGAGAIVAVGMGASLGREGGMINAGGALGSFLGVRLNLEDRHVKVLLACGAAAGIAAAYKVPIGGSVFAMEVLLGSLALELFGPIILASLVSTAVAHNLLGSDPVYMIPADKLLNEYKLVNEAEIILHLVLGGLIGLASVVFIRIFSGLDVLFRWILPLERLKPLIAMLALAGIALFLPAVLGNGFDTVNDVLGGKQQWTIGFLLGLCLLKVVATALCRAGGIPGGLFTPSLFVGALLGNAFGIAAGELLPAGSTAQPGAYALVGMGAILAGTIQAPITAILVIFEMTQDYALILPLMSGCIASAVVSHLLQAGSLYTEPLRRRGIHVPSAVAPTWLHQPPIRSVIDPHVATVSPAERFESVMKTFLMAPDGQDHLYVTGSDGKYLGIISLHAIKLFFRETDNLESVIAADLADGSFPHVYASDPVSRAVEILAATEAERLPVLDGPDSRKLLGTVSKRMLLSAYTEANLPHQTDAH